ncbi:hypothetical protein L596_026423 [Steinernema carpocapsae]|uniref:Uncharacterized protein n=1 Tax=Steinernema carpocapsae TaxID=34508 RepID=A0A4U5M1D7_STECR|nr:hypothetical protein L596_026423 [Steinernema carpocapsae]
MRRSTGRSSFPNKKAPKQRNRFSKLTTSAFLGPHRRRCWQRGQRTAWQHGPSHQRLLQNETLSVAYRHNGEDTRPLKTQNYSYPVEINL